MLKPCSLRSNSAASGLIRRSFCMYMLDPILHFPVHCPLSKSTFTRKYHFHIFCIRVFFFLLNLSIWLIVGDCSLWFVVYIWLIIYYNFNCGMLASFCGSVSTSCCDQDVWYLLIVLAILALCRQLQHLRHMLPPSM